MGADGQSDLAEVIRDLVLKTRKSEAADHRAAAEVTSGLPVYQDVDGVLVVMPDTSVLHYDVDSRRVTPVVDEVWRKIALTRAASMHDQLQRPRALRTRLHALRAAVQAFFAVP